MAGQWQSMGIDIRQTAVESHLKAKGKPSASLAGAFRRGIFPWR